MSEDDRQSFFNRKPLELITRNNVTDKDRLITELGGQNGRGDIISVATIVLPVSRADAARSREFFFSRLLLVFGKGWSWGKTK
jgi:hypothetical protein